MSNLDLNQQCPCGLGKKIKFCCKDIASDLEKIIRATEGKQYESALQHIGMSLKQHPDRPSLWSLKLTILMKTDQMEASAKANQEFLRLAPDNPIALANAAILKILSMDGVAGDSPDEVERLRSEILTSATALLHRSLGNSTGQISLQCYEALGVFGLMLVEAGHVQAGREHLLFHYAIGGEVPTQGAQMLLETGRSQEVSLLMKQEVLLPAAVDWVQWKEDYVAIRELALRGGWTQAADRVKTLIENQEAHPALLRAHAALRCRLPEPERAVAALRAVANHKDIPLDEAVEAEALAQVLESGDSAEQTDLVKVAFTINDAESVLERMQSDRRIRSLGVDFSDLGHEGQPPPKGGFMLLDREMPTTGDGLTVDAVPIHLCEVLLFGKQTDREARLETIVSRLDLEAAAAILCEIGGDAVVGSREEDVLGQTPAIDQHMTLRPQFPPDTPLEFRVQYVKDVEKHLLLDKWPKLKNPALDNKSPEEVAGDPEYKRRLMGTLLMMESVRRISGTDQNLDQLRKQLDLPVSKSIKPKPGEARRMHLARLSRLDPSLLNDEDLATVFVRASQSGVGTAVLSLGKEIVSRESLANSIKPAEVYGRMSQYATDTGQAIELMQQAQAAAEATGDSPGVWLVSEFAARMTLGESIEAQSLLNRIQTQHMDEPDVAQLVVQTLQRFGLLGPDGRPTDARSTPEAAMSGAATEGSPASDVWTPDSATTPSPSGDQPSGKKLWVPGMD